MSSKEKYKPTWNSLKRHRNPEWLDDAKYGIYYHWGIYSVPEFGPKMAKNGTWYGHAMYLEGTPQNKHHTKTYGHPSEFGYKDLIHLFTAEKFDPEEWAKLFKQVGAKFAGPVCIHHDGFAMWDSKVTKWNAAQMGPKRDTVGEMERAIRKQGLKFMVAFHHAENHWFFPHWNKNCDTSNPEYSGLYGPIHDEDSKINLQWRWTHQAKPSKEYLDDWKAKIIEVLDNYKPDLIWFDFGLGKLPDKYKREMLAYYFNKAEEWEKEVAVTYKGRNLPPSVGILDYELGRADKLTYFKWITDSSVDDQGAWSYVKEAGYKSGDTLVHNLVDRVSKNGYLLMNFGPKANGEIPEPARNCLLQIGKWLEVNGEAIYNTTPWFTAGEGKTKLARGGGFSEFAEVKYTAKDIRFTVKDNIIYAITLGWPGEEFKIKTLRKSYKKIIRQNEAARYYVMDESDIKSIKMLGVDKELEWKLTETGLKLKTPNKKPCEHAYVFKISRLN